MKSQKIKKERRRHSGKYAGMSARTIAGILGSSYYKAKILLKNKYKEGMDLKDIGDLIFEYRLSLKSEYDSQLESLLDSRQW
jgi:hypothetical protein